MKEKLTRPIRLFLVLSIFVVSSITVTITAIADPVPNPIAPPPPPPVFCFRITDIQATLDDPEGDSFDVMFQVLNWTNVRADGVHIALNEGMDLNDPVIDEQPHFNGADIDQNGRPFGSESNPPPGNITPINNDWELGTSTTLFNYYLYDDGATLPSSTAALWVASENTYDYYNDNAIPGVDLLGFTGTYNPTSALPGDSRIDFMDFASPDDVTSVISETIDNGANVLDGFVITIDDWDAGEIVSFNWNLLDIRVPYHSSRIKSQNDLTPIGTTQFGNQYGFGVVNLARVDNGATVPQIVFDGNTGFLQGGNIFYDDVWDVGDSVLRNAMNIGPEFAAEFGASLSAAYLNPDDNVFFETPNAVLMDMPSAIELVTFTRSNTISLLLVLTVPAIFILSIATVRKRVRRS